MKLLRISYQDDTLSLYNTDGSTLSSEILVASVPVGDESVVSEHSVIAYVPSYADKDESMLGTGFLNLEAVFPCIAGSGLSDVARCTKNTLGEDGFNKGNPVIGMADRGKFVDIFGTEISTYAFAVPSCAAFTPDTDGCLHNGYEFSLLCYLPRSDCEPAESF